LSDWFSKPEAEEPKEASDIEAEPEQQPGPAPASEYHELSTEVPPGEELSSDTPTTSTDPTEWFSPPPIEAVTEDVAQAEPEPAFESRIPSSVPPPSFHEPAPLPGVEEDPSPETPTTSTDPVDWFNPPAVEPVTEDAVPDDYMPPTSDASGFVSGTVSPFVKMEPAPGEITVDLTEVNGEARRLLSFRLTELDVTHRIEGDGLIARVEDLPAIQAMIAAVLEPQETVVTYLEPEPDAAGDVAETSSEAAVPSGGDNDNDIVFDLSSLSSEQRRHLSMRLTGAGIEHLWEVATDLVVSEADAPLIDGYIQEVQNPDGFGDEELAAFEGDDDVDDEEVYAAMSNLYVAADRLMQRPDDQPTIASFFDAADDVDGLPAPFGFDPRVWAQVLSLASTIAGTLDAEGDSDAVATDARTLRQLLVNYV
jgi:hypothetical protein